MVRSSGTTLSCILAAALVAPFAAPLGAMTPPPAAGGKVFVFSCAVMFATKSSGTSSTRPGFGGRSDKDRVESSISREFNLAGQDSTAYQRITDQICAGAPAELTAAGYEVVTDGIADHYGYRKALTSGQSSPQRQGQEGTSYLVFAPTGQKIMDGFVVGGVGGQGLIVGEVTVGAKIGARPVSLLYAVDFANVEAENAGRGRQQNTAKVTADVSISVGLTVVNYDPTESRCSKLSPFGEFKNFEFCNLKKGDTRLEGTYSLDESQEKRSKEPIVSVEENSGVGGAAVAAVSMLSILADRGRSGGVASFKRFKVTVDPAKYETAALEGAKGLVAPAMQWINEPDSRPKKGKK